MRQEVRAGRLDGDASTPCCASPATGSAAGPRCRPDSPPRGRRAGAAGPRAVEPRDRDDLTISRKTVSSHLEHIYTKLGVTTRTEAALFAMRTGLVDALAG